MWRAGGEEVAVQGVNGDVAVTGSVAIPAHELTWKFSRSSGPGGQGVNTADSRVELRFDVAASPSIPETLRTRALQRLDQRLVDGVLMVTASEHRSQLDNRRAALARLVALLAAALAPPAKARRPTRPSAGAVEARLASKRRRGELKRRRHQLDD
jgi:ribosome-associated protein